MHEIKYLISHDIHIPIIPHLDVHPASGIRGLFHPTSSSGDLSFIEWFFFTNNTLWYFDIAIKNCHL